MKTEKSKYTVGKGKENELEVCIQGNERELEICREYWDINEEGKFTVYVKDIVEKFNLKPIDLTALIKRCSSAGLARIRCDCGSALEIAVRGDLKDAKIKKSRGPGSKYVCRNCQETLKKEYYNRQQSLFRKEVKAKERKRNINELTFLEKITLKIMFDEFSLSKPSDKILIKALAESEKSIFPRSYDDTEKILEALREKCFLVLVPDLENNQAEDLKTEDLRLIDQILYISVVDHVGFVSDLDQYFTDHLWEKDVEPSEIKKMCIDNSISELQKFFCRELRGDDNLDFAEIELPSLVEPKLEFFPASQIACVLWRAINNSRDYYKQQRYSLKGIFRPILRNADNILRDMEPGKRDYKSFNRPRNEEQCYFSDFLSKHILDEQEDLYHVVFSNKYFGIQDDSEQQELEGQETEVQKVLSDIMLEEMEYEDREGATWFSDDLRARINKTTYRLAAKP